MTRERTGPLRDISFWLSTETWLVFDDGEESRTKSSGLTFSIYLWQRISLTEYGVKNAHPFSALPALGADMALHGVAVIAEDKSAESISNLF